MSKSAKKFLISSLPLIICLALSLVPFFWTNFDPAAQNLAIANQSPDAYHLLGTDRYGRDVLKRILYGARYSIFVPLFLVFLTMAIGTLIGTWAGWKGHKTDIVIMRICDMFLSFPGIVLALAISAVLGGGLAQAGLALLVINWPKYARFSRSEVLRIKNLSFISALKLSGVSTGRILFHHLFPHMIRPILIMAFLDIGSVMMELAGLSFLGLGPQPPFPEWGSMMYEGQSFLALRPWLLLGPGLAMAYTIISFNLFGDAFRDWLESESGE